MSNKDDDGEANRNVCHKTLLSTFEMSELQQERMRTVIRNAIHGISKLRNDKGQPIRWCYVPTLPANTRVAGMCLAMDFGCSDHYIKFSLCAVSPRTSRTTDRLKLIDSRAFVLTPSVRQAAMSYFCEFVALCIKKMLTDNGVACTGSCPTVYMGVAAGFDVRVSAKRHSPSATVLFASKDFKMEGFIGSDFVPLFQQAFKRIDLQVEITTVINDTVGILLSGIHQAALGQVGFDCSIGVLCHRGGSNLAYLETNRDFLEMCSLDKRLLLHRPAGTGHCVVVNSEAGYSIGEHNELKELENLIERHVIKELKATFRLECIISGAWYPRLLEKCIRILISTSSIDAYPRVGAAWSLNQSKGFEVFTKCNEISAGQNARTMEQLAASLAQLLDLTNLSVADASVIASICQAIVGRTAKVIAICIITIAQCIYGTLLPTQMAVAYGGSLFTSLSQLKEMLQCELNELKPMETEILLLHSDVALGCAVTAISAGLTNNIK